MITLHRFNSNKVFVLNADLIKYVEETPDTVITLQNNEKLLVSEKLEDVVSKSIEHARVIRTPCDYLSQPIQG